ncbi:putative RDD family membrane protein YckC [Lachnospiraceae bacterium PM6-15]
MEKSKPFVFKKWSDKVMMYVRRVLAQLIDLVVGVLLLFVTFAYVTPFLVKLVGNAYAAVIAAILLYIVVYYLLQYPFMKNGQTLGKAFFSLKIITTDSKDGAVPIAVIVQREILCKLMSCFFICIPLFLGKPGGHEEATHTRVVSSKHRA